MDVTVFSAVIGAIGTILAGVLGGIVGRSEGWERLFARHRFPLLAGTRWESTWVDHVEGKDNPRKETFEFTRQKRDRVYGYITMDDRPDLKWEIEGDYTNNRFLRLFWHPSPEADNKFFLDHGCYFFERRGPGSFKGYGVGYDSDQDKVDFGEHVLRQLPTARRA